MLADPATPARLSGSFMAPQLSTGSGLDDYAHLDGFIGRDAALDVYPGIVAHLDRTAAPRP